MALPFPEFLDLVTGWVLEGKSGAERNRIIRILEGEILSDDEQARDAQLAEAYREDGESDLHIQMRQELRHAKSTREKAAIRAKFADKARDLIDAAEAEKAKEQGDG